MSGGEALLNPNFFRFLRNIAKAKYKKYHFFLQGLHLQKMPGSWFNG